MVLKRNRIKTILRIILTVIFWIFLFTLVFKYPPDGFYLITFFILGLFSLILTFSFFTKYSFTLGVGIVGFLLLRFFHVQDVTSFTILAAMVLSLGFYQLKS